MDKIDKALKKLSAKERKQVKEILTKLTGESFSGLDMKKLKGEKSVYRVRKGDIRIIYRMEKRKKIFILAIERRTKGTYKNI